MLTVAISKRNKLQNIIVLTPKDGNIAKYRNRFLKWSKFGVKVERKWSKYFKDVMRNGVDSRNIICVIYHL